MGIVEVIAIAAILLALDATMVLLHPIIKEKDLPKDIRVLYYITFFCIAVIIFPFLIPVLINEEKIELFKIGLEPEIKKF